MNLKALGFEGVCVCVCVCVCLRHLEWDREKKLFFVSTVRSLYVHKRRGTVWMKRELVIHLFSVPGKRGVSRQVE
jgi:hypothetical protein